VKTVKSLGWIVVSVTFQVAVGSVVLGGQVGYKLDKKFGAAGSGDVQFSGPTGIHVDGAGYKPVANPTPGLPPLPGGAIWIVDSGNRRVQKVMVDYTVQTSTVWRTDKKWGSLGTGDGQFNSPFGIALDTTNNVYVSDRIVQRVQKFANDGSFITKWGAFGSKDGAFYEPCGIAVDSTGAIYVADLRNNRVQKFTNAGRFVTAWHVPTPIDIAFDAADNVYIASLSHQIMKFTKDGDFVWAFGKFGSGNGQFYNPSSIAVDKDGNIYVADTLNHRIQKFDSDGNFLIKWGARGTGDAQFNSPQGVAVDNNGQVYVADTGNNRIQIFKTYNLPTVDGRIDLGDLDEEGFEVTAVTTTGVTIKTRTDATGAFTITGAAAADLKTLTLRKKLSAADSARVETEGLAGKVELGAAGVGSAKAVLKNSGLRPVLTAADGTFALGSPARGKRYTVVITKEY